MTHTFLPPLRLAFFSLFALLVMPTAHAQEVAVTDAKPEVVDPRQDLENVLYLDLSTGGRVSIMLYHKLAPNHVGRIKTLARQGFYDGLVFHRVIEGFMAQTGKPANPEVGGSNLPDLQAEFSSRPHLRGTVSAARLGGDENSANSQFFITFQPRFDLDRKYSVFGRVFGGMNYVDTIKRGEPPINPDRIIQASIAADGKPAPNFDAVPLPAPTVSSE